MKNISIRFASAEDVAVVHRLLTALEDVLDASSGVRRTQEDLLRFGFSDSAFFKVLIAWRGTEAVGLALFFPEFSTWKGAPGVYLQDLYVVADMRGTGLGRQLMKAVYTHAREWGARYCKLAVHGNNDKAIAFYQQLGFRISENERVLILDDM